MPTARSVFFRLSGSRLFQSISGGASTAGVAIVTAHGVHDDVAGVGQTPPPSSMTLASLRANVNGLKRAFHLVSMDEVSDMLSGASPWRPRCVALTFDDSLRCMSHVVAPALASDGVLATFYLSTDAIDSQKPYWWLRFDYAMTRLQPPSLRLTLRDGRPLSVQSGSSLADLRAIKKILRTLSSSECESVVSQIEAHAGITSGDVVNAYEFAELMTWTDVKRLSDLGMTLGSHSVTHANLSRMPADEQQRELKMSRLQIGAVSGVDCAHFCYPYGEFSEITPSLVASAGYRSAVTTATGWNHRGECQFTLRRFPMPKESFKLAYVLSGWGQ